MRIDEMTGRIVSLRASMDELDRQDVRLQAAVRTLAGALTSIDRHLYGLYPEKLQAPAPSLAGERQRILRNQDPAVFEPVGRSIESGLSETASLIRSRLAGAVELAEVVMLLEAAARSIETDGERNRRGIEGISGGLREAMQLQTVDEFRAHIQAQVCGLTRILEEMKHQNDALLEDLQREMHSYRRQLDHASSVANRDPLTGLGNRRALEVRLAELVEARIPFCLVLIDFNRFKFINDHYGHLAGDELLRAFGLRLQAQIREDDTSVRWGGDEFVVVLPATLPDTMTRAKALERHLTGEYKVFAEDKTHRIQLSMTMAVVEHRTNETVEQLIGRADDLLYSTKTVR